MDEIDQILAEVIGPGLDRDWTAEARTIASRMNEAHGLPQLDEAAIEELANGLDGIELAGRPNLQVKPIDKTAEHAALEAVRKHADALQRLLDPDTSFGQRFLEAAERTLDASETARPSVFRIRFPRSPVAGLPGRLAFTSRLAAEEAEQLKRTPQRRRGASWRADVIGQHLPDLYDRIYPAAPIGTFRDGDGLEPGVLDGPRHRFVQMAAECLGFSDTGMAAVSRAAQRRRPRSDK